MTYHELLVIDDGMLRSMAMDPQYIRAFPCLQGHTAVLQSRPQKCSRCEKRRKDQLNQTMQVLRQCIGHLDANSRKTFKQLVNAKRVRVRYRNGKGGIVELTF